MSRQAVEEILGKVLRDRAFAESLRSDPDGTLAQFELTDAERQAIVDGTRSNSSSGPLEDRPRTASRLM